MCGICGQIGKQTPVALAHDMLKTIAHRGPDIQDSFLDDNVFLGHARLSIIDLSAEANQPMSSWDNRYLIIYNGEIYNFQELRDDLAAQGIPFKTTSDTEVIVNGFALWKNELFNKLNGIFAIAIWDKKKERATFARDRYGVKPFYYYFKDKTFVFGSEIKPILLAIPDNGSINHQAFVEFLKYGNHLGEQTLFNHIKELKPGTIIELSRGIITNKTFWSITNVKKLNISDENAVNTTRELLESAVKKQLISDVPVGVFLSGGIDSSLITAFASRHYKGKLNTYTAAFDFDKGINELENSRKISKHFGTNHHEMFIKGSKLPQIVEDLVVSHDAPFSDAANIPLYLLTKSLNKSIKVILQGDGGDEFFAGYRRYALLQKYRKPIYNSLTSLLNILFKYVPEKGIRARRMLNAFASSNDGDLMANLLSVDFRGRNAAQVLNERSWGVLNGLDPHDQYLYYNDLFKNKNIVQRMLYTDTNLILPRTFLEKVDKSTMANSIEVRVPILENELTDFVLGLPSNQKIRNGEKKWLLKKSLRNVVPDFVLDGKKTGFGVPYENWLKDPLRELMMDTFHSNTFKKIDLFDQEKLIKIADEHVKGSRNYGFILWKIMHFGIWAEKYKMSFDDA